MKSIVSEGKTSTEAIEKGLKELGCKKDDVEIKVLESEDKRTFFSILDPRTVKVELTVKEHVSNVNKEKIELDDEDYEKAKKNVEQFLESFCKNFKDIKYSIEKKNNRMNIEITGEDSSKLIGYRGDVINALQTIISSISNKNIENRVRITLDICDYRNKREKTLIELAQKLEKTVRKNGKKIVLEPMSAYERKVIHSELQKSEYVTTYSIGEEPHRKIVVDVK